MLVRFLKPALIGSESFDVGFQAELDAKRGAEFVKLGLVVPVPPSTQSVTPPVSSAATATTPAVTVGVPVVDPAKAPPGTVVLLADLNYRWQRPVNEPQRPVLSVLVASLTSRAALLERLLYGLRPQLVPGVVELLVSTDDGQNTTGVKRARLVEQARGEYVAFVDDDDIVSGDYVERLLAGIQHGHPDVVTFCVRQFFDGVYQGPALCSLAGGGTHNDLGADGLTTFWRIPNHLCAVKREISLAAGFPDRTLGEDHVHALAMLPNLKTEVHIPAFLYDYLYVQRKTDDKPAARLNGFSQNDEEAVVLGLFGGRVGRFLDIGAADGVRNSNTRALALRGWSGVCVEPCPSAYRDLAELYRDNKNVETLPYAVTVSGGKKVTFWESSGGVDGAQLSTTDPDHVEKWRASGVEFKRTTVQRLSLVDLLRRVGTDFEFVSIDTEGSSRELFNALPLADMPKLKCVCVEHDGGEAAVVERAKTFGFVEKARNPENILLWRAPDFLVKWASRSRPALFRERFSLWDNGRVRFLVTLDSDDPTLPDYLRFLDGRPRVTLDVGLHRGKHCAMNSGLAEASTAGEWDILVLAQDDVLPVADYDLEVAKLFRESPLGLDAVVDSPDGLRPAGDGLITMPILGRTYFNRFGYLYCEEYLTLWADNEYTDHARALNRIIPCSKVLLKHEWIGLDGGDELLKKNERNYYTDQATYERRKKARK